MAEKLGITPITVKSGENKAVPSGTEKFTPEQRKIIQEVIDDYYGVFVDIVAKARDMKADEVVALSAGGRIYTGRQAVSNGLVDEIGGIEDAVKWLEKEKKILPSMNIREMKIKKDKDTLFSQLGEYTGLSFLTQQRLNLDGLLLIWQPALM